MQNIDFFLIRLKHSHRELFLFLMCYLVQDPPQNFVILYGPVKKNIATIDTSCFYLAYIKQVTNTGYREPWVFIYASCPLGP